MAVASALMTLGPYLLLVIPVGGAAGPGAAPDGTVHLTSRGEAAATSLVTARRSALADLVKDWDPDHHAELAQLLTRFARHLADEPAPQHDPRRPAEPFAGG